MPLPQHEKPAASGAPSRRRRAAWIALGFVAGSVVGGGFSLDSALRRSGLYDTLSPLIRASLIIRQTYVEPLSSEEIKERLLTGFIDSLDPHSAYLPPVKYTEMRQDMSGSYGGIGVSARPAKSSIVIKEIQPGSPADKAGVKLGDEVLGIDGKVVTEANFADAFGSIRGPVGQAVKLSLRRGKTQMDISVVRAPIQTLSTQWGWLDMPNGRKALVIKSKGFNEKTVEETYQAIEKASSGKTLVSALVLDLRDNPGGLVSSAVGLSSFFLKEGQDVVTAKERDAARAHTWRASFSDWADPSEKDFPAMAKKALPSLETLPMAILVNSRSASASEIVAGAFKDWKRASIVGSTTFGKGSVQTVYSLGESQGAMKITTSRYYTPKGLPIQAIGVTPDFPVADNASQSYREADIPKHLKSETGSETLGGREPVSAQQLKEANEQAERQSAFSGRLNLEAPDAYLLKALEAFGSRAPKG